MKVLAVTLALLFGVIVGGALVTPVWAEGQAPAAAAAPPPWKPQHRYQYKCITDLGARIWKTEVLEALNAEGARGWRLLDGLSPGNHLNGPDQYCFIREY